MSDLRPRDSDATLDFVGHHKWRELEVSFTEKLGRRVGVRTPDLCRVKAALYR